MILFLFSTILILAVVLQAVLLGYHALFRIPAVGDRLEKFQIALVIQTGILLILGIWTYVSGLS
jgi:hypothetical protein